MALARKIEQSDLRLDFLRYFRTALGAFLSTAYGSPVDPRSLFVTTGASAALDLLCTLLGSDGQTVEGEFAVEAGIDPTDFSLRLAMPAGTHYLRFGDEGDDGADLANSYSVRASYEPDPDANEPNGNFETEQQNRNKDRKSVV